MKNQTKFISTLSLAAFLSTATANDGTPYPLGTSDLAPNKRLDEFRPKETRIEPIKWLWDSESVKLTDEESNLTSGEFKFADQRTVKSLQVENKKLKERVTELELRLGKLEEILSTKEQTSH